ncbi:MAG: hypothetical protein RLP44_29665 [Aggregatilineales bacterium]
MNRKTHFHTILVLLVAVFAGSLVINAQIRDTIRLDEDGNADLRSYPVFLDAGDVITVTVTRLTGDLLPFVGIVNENGQVLARQSAEGSSQVILTYDVEGVGDYEVQVTQEGIGDEATFGDYIIQITIANDSQTSEDVLLPWTDNLESIVIVQTTRTIFAEINDESQQHFYDIFVRAGRTLSLEMQRMDGDLNPNVGVVDISTQSVLARGQSVSDELATLTFSPETSGWYRIGTTRFDPVGETSSGNYRLDVQIQ